MSRDASLYVPVHAGLRDSRKVRRLMRIADEGRAIVVGGLVLLWTAAVDCATSSGRLEGWDKADIEDATDNMLEVEHLVEAGFLDLEDNGDCADPTYRLHEWELYGGRGVVERERARDRMATLRSGSRTCANVREQNANTPEQAENVPVTSPERERTFVVKGKGKGKGEEHSLRSCDARAHAHEGEPVHPDVMAWWEAVATARQGKGGVMGLLDSGVSVREAFGKAALEVDEMQAKKPTVFRTVAGYQIESGKLKNGEVTSCLAYLRASWRAQDEPKPSEQQGESYLSGKGTPGRAALASAPKAADGDF